MKPVRNRVVCECQDLSIITISETVTLLKHCCNIIQHHTRRKDKKSHCCTCFSSMVSVLKHVNFSQHLLALAGTNAFQHLSTQSAFFVSVILSSIRTRCPDAKCVKPVFCLRAKLGNCIATPMEKHFSRRTLKASGVGG